MNKGIHALDAQLGVPARGRSEHGYIWDTSMVRQVR